VRVHGLEADDVVEAGLVHAQPLQRPLHVRAIGVGEQLRAYGCMMNQSAEALPQLGMIDQELLCE
jgi:hypothetical protein